MYAGIQRPRQTSDLQKERRKIMKTVIAILLLAANLQAADTPKFNEVSKLRLVAAYQKAVIESVKLQSAQKSASDAVNAFNAMCESETKTAGLPKGTNCQVNLDTQEVSAVLPAPEKKAEKT